MIGDSVYTVEPAEQSWPPFGEPLAELDKDNSGSITIAEAADNTIWARSLIGIDRNIGNGDNIVTREEYATASSGAIGGGLARTKVDGEGDVSGSVEVYDE